MTLLRLLRSLSARGVGLEAHESRLRVVGSITADERARIVTHKAVLLDRLSDGALRETVGLPESQAGHDSPGISPTLRLAFLHLRAEREVDLSRDNGRGV
jgi:hypothetical protein